MSLFITILFIGVLSAFVYMLYKQPAHPWATRGGPPPKNCERPAPPPYPPNKHCCRCAQGSINKAGRNPPPPKNFNKPPPTPNPPPTNAAVTLHGVSESFIKALQHTQAKHADIIKKLEDK